MKQNPKYNFCISENFFVNKLMSLYSALCMSNRLLRKYLTDLNCFNKTNLHPYWFFSSKVSKFQNMCINILAYFNWYTLIGYYYLFTVTKQQEDVCELGINMKWWKWQFYANLIQNKRLAIFQWTGTSTMNQFKLFRHPP